MSKTPERSIINRIENCPVIVAIRSLRFEKGQPSPTKPIRKPEEVNHIIRRTPAHKPGTNSGTGK